MRTVSLGLCIGAAAAFSPMARPAMVGVRAPAIARFAQVPRLTEDAAIPADAAPVDPPAAAESEGMMETLTTGAFFALWYLFNIGYNIYNKKALNALPIPYTMALLQLFVGIPYVALLWATGLRKAPKLSKDNIKTLIPVSLGHLGTHIGAVVSLGAGKPSEQ